VSGIQVPDAALQSCRNIPTSLLLLVGKAPTAIPNVLYAESIHEKTIDNLDDGVWYFHVQQRNEFGWGAVSHFRFQIDTTPPENVSMEITKGASREDPWPLAIIHHGDATSGMLGYCEIKINDGEWLQSSYLSDDGLIEPHVFRVPPITPGSHTIIVRVSDKAGNKAIVSGEFSIEPLETPTVTDYSKNPTRGDMLELQGTTKYPNSSVTVLVQKEKEEPVSESTQADDKGNFVFVAKDRLDDGIYTIRVEVVNKHGARSDPTGPIIIAVKRPPFIVFGTGIVTILAVIIPLIALLFMLVVVVWYGWHRFTMIKKKIKKETYEAEDALRKAFDLLREETYTHIEKLEKVGRRRNLTKEEEHILEKFKKNLDDAERYIAKEIKDIEKEIGGL